MSRDGLVFWRSTPLQVAELCRGQVIYLATPYSKRVALYGEYAPGMNFKLGIEAAFEAMRLVRLGVCVHAPIVTSAMVLEAQNRLAEAGAGFPQIDPLDADFWEAVNRPALDMAGAVVVPDLPGWSESAGVLGEIASALRSNKRVFLFAPERAGVI